MACSLENSSGTVGVERRPKNRARFTLRQRLRKGLEKELASRAFRFDHPSKLLLYPTGRRGPNPVATREDQSGSLWAGTATYPSLPKTKDRFQRDRYGKSPTNQSTCFFNGENILIVFIKNTTICLLYKIQTTHKK